MSARLRLALLFAISGVSLSIAQPRIAPSDMAGRERERFIDSPAERFMKPGPYVERPLIEQSPRATKRHTRRPHSKRR